MASWDSNGLEFEEGEELHFAHRIGQCDPATCEYCSEEKEPDTPKG